MSQIVEIALVLAAIVLVTHVALAAGLMLYGWVRRKGYRGYGATVVLIASALPATASGIAFMPEGGFWLPAMMFVLPLTVWAISASIVIALLPRQTRRQSGQRHVSRLVTLLGWSIGISGCALGGAAVVFGAMGQRSIGLAINGAAVAVVCVMVGRYVARRVEPPREASIDELLKTDRRAPVLFLRAFETERQPFAIGDGAQFAKYAKDFQQFSGLGQTVGIPFEQYVSDAVGVHLGPFVALGSPEDYLTPHGAVRDYASDADWKQTFQQLAERAQCVLAEFRTSASVAWELECLRRHRLHTRLFVVTPPVDQSAGLGGFYVRWMARLRGLSRPPSWQGFRDTLHASGYVVTLDDPGPGAVLSFDEEGKAFVLTAEALSPEDFISPIAVWVRSHVKTGRHEPVSCAKCSRIVYASIGEAQVLCRRCRSPHRGVRRAAALVLSMATGLIVALGLGYPDDFLPPGSWIHEHTWLASGILIVALLVALAVILPDDSQRSAT